jgi:hypothetical protein
MALHLGVERADFLQLHFFIGFAVQMCGNPGAARSRQGDHHRAEGRREQQAAEPSGHQVVLLHLRHQCKAELAALGQGQAATPGGLPVAATQFDQQRDHAALDQQQRQGQSEINRP